MFVTYHHWLFFYFLCIYICIHYTSAHIEHFSPFLAIIVNIMLPTFHSNLGRSIWLFSPQHIRICVTRTLEWGDVMEIYSCGNRQLFTLGQAHVMKIATSTKFVPNACIWYHLVILVIKSKPISKWIMLNWASHARFSPFSNGSCQMGHLMPTLAHFQMNYAKLGLSCPL